MICRGEVGVLERIDVQGAFFLGWVMSVKTFRGLLTFPDKSISSTSVENMGNGTSLAGQGVYRILSQVPFRN